MKTFSKSLAFRDNKLIMGTNRAARFTKPKPDLRRLNRIVYSI